MKISIDEQLEDILHRVVLALDEYLELIPDADTKAAVQTRRDWFRKLRDAHDYVVREQNSSTTEELQARKNYTNKCLD